MAEFIRQQSIVDQAKLEKLKIAIIGTGSIGSFTALALTKIGIKSMTLWDKDEVELHNISNQFFRRDSIGVPKVQAVLEECQRFTPTEIFIETKMEHYDGQSLDDFQVVIVLTDNIEGRASAFKAAQSSMNTQLFIDGRMGGELFKVFCFNPKITYTAKEYYDDYIDGVVNEELPCTARSIAYNVLGVASIITSFVKKHVNGERIPFQLSFNFGDYSFSKSKLE